jgi:hypothetical protein
VSATAADGSAKQAASPTTGQAAVLASLGELHDQSQYAEELDLGSFVAKLNQTRS